MNNGNNHEKIIKEIFIGIGVIMALVLVFFIGEKYNFMSPIEEMKEEVKITRENEIESIKKANIINPKDYEKLIINNKDSLKRLEPLLSKIGQDLEVPFVKTYTKNSNTYYEVGYFDDKGDLQWILFNDNSQYIKSVKRLSDYEGPIKTDKHIIKRIENDYKHLKENYKSTQKDAIYQYIIYLNEKGFMDTQYTESTGKSTTDVNVKVFN